MWQYVAYLTVCKASLRKLNKGLLEILIWVHRCFGENQQAISLAVILSGATFWNHVCIMEIVFNCQHCLYGLT